MAKKGIIRFGEDSDQLRNQAIFVGDPLDGKITFEGPDIDLHELIREEMKLDRSFYSPYLNNFRTKEIPNSWYTLASTLSFLSQNDSLVTKVISRPDLPEVDPTVKGVAY